MPSATVGRNSEILSFPEEFINQFLVVRTTNWLRSICLAFTSKMESSRYRLRMRVRVLRSACCGEGHRALAGLLVGADQERAVLVDIADPRPVGVDVGDPAAAAHASSAMPVIRVKVVYGARSRVEALWVASPIPTCGRCEPGTVEA